jgi:hypothetical protein
MSEQLFALKAPGIMASLMADFGITDEDAAAILGNIGHETGGFSYMQEIKPASGRGGYGWCQWTGGRRDAFEAYCRRNGYDPASSEANYKWLYLELKGSEKAAIPAVMLAPDLDSKVIAFERSFERAGVLAYSYRQNWARIALKAYRGTDSPRKAPPVAQDGDQAPPRYPDPGNGKRPSTGLQNGLAGLVMAAIAAGVVFLIRRFG